MKMILSFTLPVIFSLLVNELRTGSLRKAVQGVACLPHFLSWVIIASVWNAFLSPSTDGANQLRALLGLAPVDLMTSRLTGKGLR